MTKHSLKFLLLKITAYNSFFYSSFELKKVNILLLNVHVELLPGKPEQQLL